MTWRLEDDELGAFYNGIDESVPPGVYSVGIECGDDGVKVRVNEGPWSPALGVAE